MAPFKVKTLTVTKHDVADEGQSCGDHVMVEKDHQMTRCGPAKLMAQLLYLDLLIFTSCREE